MGLISIAMSIIGTSAISYSRYGAAGIIGKCKSIIETTEIAAKMPMSEMLSTDAELDFWGVFFITRTFLYKTVLKRTVLKKSHFCKQKTPRTSEA